MISAPTAPRVRSDRYERALRITQAIGTRSYARAGHELGVHPETLRRYCHGTSAPSVEFLFAVSETYAVNPDWLLHGRGYMWRSEQQRHAIETASPRELLRALVDKLRNVPAGA